MKRLIIFIFVVCGLAVGAVAAAPFIAATDLAKRRIATQIEEWTGRPVSFTGEPTVELFPFLSLTIEDATIGDTSTTGGEPFVVMEKLTCKLRLLPFLIGRTDVAEFQLVRPHFRLAVDADGRTNWLMRRGAIASSAAKAPGDVSSSADNAPSQIAKIRLGSFKIIDGTVSYDNLREGRHEEFSGLSLNLRWPELAKAASGTGAFMWRDELVEFNGSITEPLKLIEGEASAARFAVASKPVRVSFTGTANSLGSLQFQGATTVTAPSVRRVVEWLGTPMDEGSILGAGLIEGQINWIGPTFSFADARIELDGNSAVGTVAIDVAGQRPKILGTLALERLDLSAYLETFQAGMNIGGSWLLAEIGMPLLDIADADIRLSAGEILLGAARIGKSAASVAINHGKLTVDIGEANFYGGSLEATGALEMLGSAMTGTTSIAIAGTPAGIALSNLAGLSLFDGTTSATIDLKSHGETWGELVQDIDGTAKLAVSDGKFIGLELGQLAALSGGLGVTDPAAGSGTIPVKSLTGTLEIGGGAIHSNDIHAVGETFTLDLSGRVSMINSSLQAKGVLNAEKADGGTTGRREIPFIVGGSLSAPMVLPDYERLIRRGTEPQPPAAPVGPASDQTRPNG